MSASADQLVALTAAGLTIDECIEGFAALQGEARLPYVRAAIGLYQDTDQVEIDGNAVISGSGDGGEYVLAWVWVSNYHAGVMS